eukprot:gene2013-3912_t
MTSKRIKKLFSTGSPKEKDGWDDALNKLHVEIRPREKKEKPSSSSLMKLIPSGKIFSKSKEVKNQAQRESSNDNKLKDSDASKDNNTVLGAISSSFQKGLLRNDSMEKENSNKPHCDPNLNSKSPLKKKSLDTTTKSNTYDIIGSKFKPENNKVIQKSTVVNEMHTSTQIDDQVALAAEESEQIIQPTFHILRIKRITCTDLKNVELIRGSENDPYVTLSIGSKFLHHTTVQRNGGSNVQWEIDPDDSSWIMNVTDEDLEKDVIEVVVKDHNDLRSHVLIGQGSLPLSLLASTKGEVELTVQLLLKTKASGTVTIKFELITAGATVRLSVTHFLAPIVTNSYVTSIVTMVMLNGHNTKAETKIVNIQRFSTSYVV